MHISKSFRSAMHVASFAAGLALISGSQSASAGPAEKTHVVTVKPIARPVQGANSASRVTTGPNNTVTVHVGSGPRAGSTSPGQVHSVTLTDQNGKGIYYNNPHGRVVIGTTKDGKPILSDYYESERIYQRVNKDHSVDLIHEVRRDGGSTQTRVEHYKNAPPPKRANLGGDCVFGVCW